MKKLSTGYTLAETMQRQHAAYQQQEDVKKKREKEAALKRREYRKMQNSELDRKIGGQLMVAEKKDKAIRTYKDTETGYAAKRKRRNGASCLDPIERQARILCVLKNLCEHFKLKYCFPSQATIQERLKAHYGLDISISTLNADLKYMEAKGHIKRKRRLSRTKFTSTLYMITKIGSIWWGALRKAFGLFKKSRLRNLRNNYVILRIIGFKEGTNFVFSPHHTNKVPPNGEILMA